MYKDGLDLVQFKFVIKSSPNFRRMRICIALTAMAVLLEASEEGEFCNNG